MIIFPLDIKDLVDIQIFQDVYFVTAWANTHRATASPATEEHDIIFPAPHNSPLIDLTVPELAATARRSKKYHRHTRTPRTLQPSNPLLPHLDTDPPDTP